MKNIHATKLGMNASTASHRLVKDTLFRLAIEAGYKCYRCGGELSRDTFSIEHKQSWVTSDDPVAMYFDQGNIAFSHQSCNSSYGARPHKIHATRQDGERVRWKRRYDDPVRYAEHLKRKRKSKLS